MQLATAGHLEAVSGVCLLYTQADVGIQLPHQALADMAGSDEFTFLTCQRAVVYHEIHGNGRLRNLLERNCLRFLRGAQGITDVDICDTGNRYDRTDLCFLYFYFIQTFKLIELTDLNFAELVRLMMVDDDAVLIYFQVAVVDLTNADTSYILVVINRADQNLCFCIRISLRRRDVIQNGLEQWLHIHIRIVQVLLCISRTCRCI